MRAATKDRGATPTEGVLRTGFAAGEDVHEGGLAGAAGAHERGQHAGAEHARDALQQLQLLAGAAQALPRERPRPQLRIDRPPAEGPGQDMQCCRTSPGRGTK